MITSDKKAGTGIAKNSLVFFTGTVLEKIFAFIAIVLITRYLGEDEFGIFSYALVYTSFFAVFIDFGTESILIREISKNPGSSEILIGNNILMKLFFTLSAIVLSFGIIQFADFSYDKEILIYIMLINLVFSPKLPTLKNSFEAAFKARIRVGFPVLMNILGSLVLLISVIIVIYINGSIRLITLCYVLCGLPGLVLLIRKSDKLIKPSFSIDLKVWKYFIKESLPLAFYWLLISLSNRIDVLMLSWMKGDAEVGYYAAAFRLILPLSFIPVALTVSILPVMSKLNQQGDEGPEKLFQLSLKIMLCLSVPLAAVIFHSSDQIIDLIYTQRYFSSSAGLRILAVSQVFLFQSVIMYHLIIAVGKQGRGIIVVAQMVIVNFLLNIFLIPKYGLVGASISTVITEFSALLLWIVFTKKYLRNFQYVSCFNIILINIICIIYLRLTIDSYFIAGIAGFFIIQILLIKLFKIFTKEELNEFKTAVR